MFSGYGFTDSYPGTINQGCFSWLKSAALTVTLYRSVRINASFFDERTISRCVKSSLETTALTAHFCCGNDILLIG